MDCEEKYHALAMFYGMPEPEPKPEPVIPYAISAMANALEGTTVWEQLAHVESMREMLLASLETEAEIFPLSYCVPMPELWSN